MFLLLMLFLFKYIDDLVGKGFEWYVVLELMFYASASQVSVALPLAVLLSAIMTYGSLGEQYELVALKSGGISLQRALAPLFILVAFISIAAFLFSNYVLPVANLKMGSLLYDVRQQKPAFLIKEGIFYDGIEGYTIRVDKKDKDGVGLYGIMIYNHSQGMGNTNVLLADSGEMVKSADGRFLTFKLKNGVRYEEQSGQNQSVYDPRRQFSRVYFKENETAFDLSGFQLNRTDESLFKSNFLMLNVSQLSLAADSLKRELAHRDSTYSTFVKPYFHFYRPGFSMKNAQALAVPVADRQTYSAAMNTLRSVKAYYDTEIGSRDGFYRNLLRFMIEWHRRFTISVACLVFFIIGAPLGAIVRKGGLGMPVVISVGLFILNYILSMTTEKYCRDATLPVYGMWIATAVFIPAGIYLLQKAAKDSVIFDMETYTRFFSKLKWNK